LAVFFIIRSCRYFSGKVDKTTSQGKIAPARSNIAEVAEQADALRSGRSGLYAHVGSTPTFGTEIVSNFWLETFFIGPRGGILAGDFSLAGAGKHLAW
jgi:hypothetical protein